MTENSSTEPTESHSPLERERGDDNALRIGWFEKVTSLLTALMLLIGTVVGLLGVVWLLTGEQVWDEAFPPEQKIVRGTINPPGIERDFVEPGAEETSELEQPSMKDQLLAVTDAVSHVAGSVSSAPVSQDGSEGDNGDGDDRLRGPESADNIVPRFERWQLEFRAKDLATYARQLDHFGIELGLIGGSIQGVDYAYDLSGAPKLRRGDAESEKRLYFMWQRPSPLMKFDRELLSRAGAQWEQRHILQFIPKAVENHLARIELEHAMSAGRHGDASVESIAKTVFTSVPEGNGYRFVVSDQRYKKPMPD